MVKSMALGAQDSRYFTAIAFAVRLPERSWSSQLSEIIFSGTSIRHIKVMAGANKL